MPNELHTFIAVNKPIDVTVNQAESNSIFEYLPEEKMIALNTLPKNMDGLVLFTTDRAVKNQIKKNGIEKEYVIRINKPATRAFIDTFRHQQKSKSKILVKKATETKLHFTLNEQDEELFNELFSKTLYTVKHAHCIRVGAVKLLQLGAGNTRQLTKNERNQLLIDLGL